MCDPQNSQPYSAPRAVAGIALLFTGTTLPYRRLEISRASSTPQRLQIQRPGFDFRRYQIFWQVEGLERGPLSLVSTTEELLGRKCSGSCPENRYYGLRDLTRWPRDTLPSAKVGTNFANKRTKATELFVPLNDSNETQNAYVRLTADTQKYLKSQNNDIGLIRREIR
jgi:hypothetical protein